MEMITFIVSIIDSIQLVQVTRQLRRMSKKIKNKIRIRQEEEGNCIKNFSAAKEKRNREDNL